MAVCSPSVCTPATNNKKYKQLKPSTNKKPYIENLVKLDDLTVVAAVNIRF